jgi:NADPH:quinone reductase-like Zn-dependent oxidoreductase/SAM-dependent methyltransferase
MRALSQVFDAAVVGRGRVGLGTAKAAVGHLEAAAGVAGLIAAALALKHATIPPIAGFSSPNPALNLADTAFSPAGAPRAWEHFGAAPRRAGVSSFGIGGANAHVVLEEAPLSATPTRVRPPPPVFQRQRYWRDPPSRDQALNPELPGRLIDTPLAHRLYEARLSPSAPAWLGQHVVAGVVTLPGAAYGALAVEVAEPGDAVSLGALDILRSVGVSGADSRLQTVIGADGGLRFHARADGAEGWTLCAQLDPPGGAAPVALGTLDVVAALGRCGVAVEEVAFYDRMAAAGIVLGVEFRRLVDVRAGVGEAVARLRPGGPLTATLDGMFQALGAATPTDAVACLPAGFDRLSLSRSALAVSAEDGADAASWPVVHARLRDGATAAGVVGDVVLARADGAIIARIDGLICRPAEKTDAATSRHLYRPLWRPAELARLAAPTEVVAAMTSDRDLAAYPGYLARIDALAAVYAAVALERGGVIVPLYDRLLPRLRAMAADAVPGADPAVFLAEIQALYPAQAPETGMLARCGGALDRVLTGTTDPLALLFAAAPDAAGAVYAESAYAGALNDVLTGALRAGLGDARGLRALEIGGGTGGATRHVLPALADRLAVYRFTDVSSAFLVAAEEAFGHCVGFETALFDMEADPATQGAPLASFDLVIASNALHVARDLRRALRHAAAALKPGGWLVLVEGLGPSRWLDLTFGLTAGWWHGADRDLRPDYPLLDAQAWRRLLAEEGFDDVALATPGVGRLGEQAVIVARRAATAAAPVLVCRAALDGVGAPVARVLAWLQALTPGDVAALVLTRGAQRVDPFDRPDPDQAAVLGLVKAAALERRDWRLRLVDLDPLGEADDDAHAIAGEIAAGDDESETAWRRGHRRALRLARLEDTTLPDGFRFRVEQPGGFDGVAMTAGEPIPTPGPGEVVIRVEAAGLNFKDVLSTLGMVDPAPLGGECAGTLVAVGAGVADRRAGDRVMAVGGGCLADHVCLPAARTARLPPGMTAAQAAATPVAGFTAWHAMVELAGLAPGRRVLIHSATGAVGQFALSLARAAGSRVLATAGSPQRRAFLRRQEGVEAVFDSRDPNFASAIRAVIGADGVDVVLNSLGGEAIPAGLSLLRPGGRFIELGRVGVWSAERVAAACPGVDYHIVALDRIDDAEGDRLLRATLEAVLEGRMRLPPLSPLPMAAAVDGLRLMSRARHLGKIVLTRPPRFAFRPDRGYLITGGLGGVGLAVAEWAVSRGARALALVSRGDPGADAFAAIARMTAKGAVLRIIRADVSRRDEVADMLATMADNLPPLAGVFHAAGVLDDAPFAQMDAARLAGVMGAKIDAARHLDALTRDLLVGPLDAFVLFGSAAGLLGSGGQANHAAANTALDALAERRRAEGLPAVSIAWGAWRDVGAAAKRNVADRLAGSGMGALSTAEGLAALARALDADEARVAVLPIDWPTLTRHFGGTLPPLLRDAEGGAVAEKKSAPAAVAPQRPTEGGALADVLRALPPARRTAHMAERVAVEAAALLSTGGKPVGHDRPLNEMGLDSLLSVELRNRLARLVGKSLPATLLFNYPTIAALAGHLTGLIVGDAGDAGLAPSPAPPPSPSESAPEPDADDFDSFLSALEERYAEP